MWRKKPPELVKKAARRTNLLTPAASQRNHPCADRSRGDTSRAGAVGSSVTEPGPATSLRGGGTEDERGQKEEEHTARSTRSQH